MKTAVIALSKNGVKNGEKMVKKLRSDIYIFEKYAKEGAYAFSSLGELVKEIFGKYDGIIFICAVGIAVRAVAPHLRSKFADPAIVAVDEGGRFAVSLVSGHVGGANALAEKVAEIIGAIPVITTATDAGGKFSPDSFAKANGLYILEKDMAKRVAAATVNGEETGFYSDYPYENMPVDLSSGGKIGVCVSVDESKQPFNETLHLVPKNIILGAGCRKGLKSSVFEDFVLKILKNAKIPLYRLSEVRSIDLKRDEGAIIDFCDKYSLPFKTYTANELNEVEGEFEASEFVLKTVGTDNVCERCAALGGGRIILGKTAGDGATLAAAETEITLDFERRTL